ncbi:MAG: acyl carrier protein [Candidatus Eisenbacteria bacterium]|nr:acyl carrier protein [Candidatus Eisenbacteria bacterium]
MDEIREAVLEYVIDEYIDEDDDVEMDADTALISSGIVDSFSMVSLKAFLEKKYDIKISDEDATPVAFDTVNSIVQIVEKYTS